MTQYKSGTKLRNYNGVYMTRTQKFFNELAFTTFWSILGLMFIYCLFA